MPPGSIKNPKTENVFNELKSTGAVFNSKAISIHPFSFAYPGQGCGGSKPSKAPQTSLFPATFSRSSWGTRGIPRPDAICNPFSVFWVCFPPVGHARNTSNWRRPGGILILTQRSSGCAPSSAQMSEFLTPSLRLSPATPQRKLISAT